MGQAVSAIAPSCGHHCGVSMGTTGHCSGCHRWATVGAPGCDERPPESAIRELYSDTRDQLDEWIATR
jgi:hypothetical protein